MTFIFDSLVKSSNSRERGNPEGMQLFKNTGFPFSWE